MKSFMTSLVLLCSGFDKFGICSEQLLQGGLSEPLTDFQIQSKKSPGDR